MDPALQRIVELRDRRGWVFVPFYEDDELNLITGARRWPGGWTDAIAIRGLDSTKAFRCDPDGDIVWRREGGLLDVTNELLDLPLPGERLVIAPPERPWVP